MKKTVTLILAFVMCLSFVGCESSPDITNKSKDYSSSNSIIQNNNHNRITAEDENYIYFYNVNEILKMSKADDSVETVYTFDGEDLMSFFSIEYFEGTLFMISAEAENRLVSINTDGTDMKKSETV